MNLLSRISAELVNRPLLCLPDYAETLAAFLGGRIGVDNSELNAASYKSRDPSPVESQTARGVAVIPIMGSLTHRASFLDAESGMTSYQAIGDKIDMAMSDDDVSTILLEIDSPGGAVMGAFDLADKIYAAAQTDKNVIAFVDGLCCSAAYLLASQANEIVATQTSQIGSIGVVMMHLDRSKQLEGEGIKPTFIFRGDRKIDGTQAKPLSKDAKESFQASVDESYEMFVNAVSRGRGLSQDGVMSTEAGVFSIEAAIELGLADQKGTFNDALRLALNHGQTQGVMMSAENKFTQADLDAAVAAAVKAAAAESESAVQAAANAERDRIAAIMSLDEYKGREKLAQKFIDKGMSAEDAKEFLSAAPVEKSANDSAGLSKTAQSLANAVVEEAAADVGPDQASAGAAGSYQGANPQFATAHSAIKAMKAAKYGMGR